MEDFDVCHSHYPDLPVIVPVDDNGVLTGEAGSFAGMDTQAASKAIAKHLEETGALFAVEKIVAPVPALLAV